MKTTFTTAAIILALSGTTALAWGNNRQEQGQGQAQAQAQGQAQGQSQSSTNRNTNRNTNANANVNVAAQSQTLSGNNSGASVNIQDRGQAPSVSAPNMSSGHPCAYSRFSLGFSIVGGGASGGGNKIDNACMLGQMGYTQAAMIMIAQQDPEARKALIAAGAIQAAPAAPVTSTRSPAPVRVSYTSCKTDSNGAIRVGVRAGASTAVKDTAVAQCRAALD